MSDDELAEKRRKIAAYARAWRTPDNPAYVRYLSAQRLKRTGFTDALYAERMVQQDGKCAICGDTGEDGRWGVLHGDHDHDTMRPRGLLCHNCNTALGLFKEDRARLRSAINYLAQYAAARDVPDETEGTV